jgi:hypothetical protein
MITIWKSAAKYIYKYVLLILIILALGGCYETKRQAYSERRGLMMLDKHEYSRNQGVYKPSKVKKQVDRKIKKRDK